MKKINNKLLEAKALGENTTLLDTLRSLNKELHKWREEVTTVIMKDVATEDTES